MKKSFFVVPSTLLDIFLLTSFLNVAFWVVVGSKIPHFNIFHQQIVICSCLFFLLLSFFRDQKIRLTIFFISVCFALLAAFFYRSIFLPFFVLSILFSPRIFLTDVKSILFKSAAFFQTKKHTSFKTVFAIGMLTFTVFLFYSHSFQSYFEGDEWVYFRQYAPLLSSKIWFIEGFLQTFRPIQQSHPHITPIADAMYVIEFKLFGLEFQKYLFVSLLLHAATSAVLAKLAYDITHSRQITILSTLFFALNSVHAEAFLWIMASMNTQLAVFFGLASVVIIHHVLTKPARFSLLALGYILLLFSLWSKETAIIFPLIIFFLLWRKKPFHHLRSHALLLMLCIFIFVLTEYIGRGYKISAQQLKFSVGNQPFLYTLFDNYSKRKLGELPYRVISLFLKMLAQSLVPINLLTKLSKYITELQFPYFNQEKSVRGTTYLQFVQIVMPEMLSYVFGSIVLFVAVIKRKLLYEFEYRFSLFMFCIGVLPILTILIGFPWLKYESYISSRHFYHVLPGLSLVIGIFVSQLLEDLSKRIGLAKATVVVYAIFLVFILLQYSFVVENTIQRQKDNNFQYRKNIVKTLMSSLDPVPKKMILYTESNKSYYGFGYWMLPFPTAFSHMLPVIFSRQYNQAGLNYPESFFTDDYLQESVNGLVTQGFHENGAYALGYYLDEIALIKKMEQRHLTPDLVFAFKFNGDTGQFEQITQSFREKITKVLESRKIFQDWQKFGSQEDKISFQVPQNWSLKHESDRYVLSDAQGITLIVTVYPNQENIQFAQFISKISEKSPSILQMSSFQSDLDQPRVMATSQSMPHILYTVAGNNEKFYKIEFHTPLQKQIIRTFEFVDQNSELVSL